MHKNQHYIQKAILNKFSSSTGNKKVNVIDIVDFSVNIVDTRVAMTHEFLYDFSFDDSKELELNLNKMLESSFSNLLNDKLIDAKDEIEINRKELELIKKYILIQIYRSYRNMTGYINVPKGAVELSDYNIEDEELKTDFWKREMATILEKDFTELISDNKFVGIKRQADEVYQSFLMFFKTDQEFIINDSGVVYERIPIKIDRDKHDEYIELAERLGKKLYGVEGFSNVAKYEIENNTSYIDNFLFMPISPKLAVLSVNVLWKYHHFGHEIKQLKSPLMTKYISFPQNKYVNLDKILRDAKQDIEERKITDSKQQRLIMDSYIPKYKSEEDTYNYKVIKINKEETQYLNHLMMNETFRYICYKNEENMIDLIKSYNYLQSTGVPNIKKNFKGFVDLIKKQ